MSEAEPIIRLAIGEEEHEITRTSGHLYTHMGHLAMYDHLFLVTRAEGTQLSGMFLFRNLQLREELFAEIQEYMIENDYHTDLNRPQVTEDDSKAYDDTVEAWTKDVGDTIPEDWS